MGRYEEVMMQRKKICSGILDYQIACKIASTIFPMFSLFNPELFSTITLTTWGMSGLTLPLTNRLLRQMSPEEYIAKQKDMQELQRLYYTYLETISDVLKKHQLTHPFQIADICTNLIGDGYFSKDFTFAYDKINQYQYHLSPLEGPRVMSGTAVCRHISRMTSDFASCFSVDMPVLIGSLVYPWQSRKKALHKNVLHAVNLLEVNGKKLAWDVTNDETYLFVSKDKMESFYNQYQKNVIYLVKEQQKACESILALPSLTKEEYKKEVASCKTTPNDTLYDDLFKAHQGSLENLERICQIEESYSCPKVQKAKVFVK